MPTLSHDKLALFATRLLTAAGAGEAEAARVAESLVESNLRGHDSHGVMRIPDYAAQLRTGELVADAELRTLAETESLLATDARSGFGQVQCTRLIERLEPKVRRQGVACGTISNCGHVGRLGEWVERVARAGLAGLMTVNDNGVLQCVAPPGGLAPRISTNPLAIGVPTSAAPLILDMSTSAAANGKIALAHLAGERCPPGWLQDAAGRPTTDPSVRFCDPPGTILPLGGGQGYKGFGLGLLLDILAGGLSGGLCPPANQTAAMTNNVLIVIWDPERFAGRTHCVAEADKLTQYVRDCPRKPAAETIRLPGDRGDKLRRERIAGGIPLDAGTWQSLVGLAQQLEVEHPYKV